MEEVAFQDVIWILFAIVGAAVTFYVFGAELPTYLAVSSIGLFLYATASNPLVKFSAGWIGRIAAILFIVSLIYYIGAGMFFPEDIFEFKFLKVWWEFVNEMSKALGGFILNATG